jgi:hypothetical protein
MTDSAASLTSALMHRKPLKSKKKPVKRKDPGPNNVPLPALASLEEDGDLADQLFDQLDAIEEPERAGEAAESSTAPKRNRAKERLVGQPACAVTPRAHVTRVAEEGRSLSASQSDGSAGSGQLRRARSGQTRTRSSRGAVSKAARPTSADATGRQLAGYLCSTRKL